MKSFIKDLVKISGRNRSYLLGAKFNNSISGCRFLIDERFYCVANSS